MGAAASARRSGRIEPIGCGLASWRPTDPRRPRTGGWSIAEGRPASGLRPVTCGGVRSRLWRLVRWFVERGDGGRCPESELGVERGNIVYEIYRIVPMPGEDAERPADVRTLSP